MNIYLCGRRQITMRKILLIIGLLVLIVGSYCSYRGNISHRNYRKDSVEVDTSITISKANFEKLKDSLNLGNDCRYFPCKGKAFKALFYMINNTKDTFYYVVNKDNSITRIAIFYKGGGINEREYTYPKNEIKKR